MSRKSWKDRIRALFWWAIPICFCLLVWEVTARLAIVDPLLFPAPSSIFRALCEWARSGELLTDAPYAEYVVEPRERARTLYLDGTVARVTTIAAADPGEATLLLERGLETDPFWAEGLKLLMECLQREGRTLAALRRYRAFEKRMLEDLGSAPDELLRQSYEALTGRALSS